jgi:hypothetical protein
LHELEGKGLIRSVRNRVRILDRGGLERTANGFYGVPEDEYRRLFGEDVRRHAARGAAKPHSVMNAGVPFGTERPLGQLTTLRVIASPTLAIGTTMTNYLAGLRAIYLRTIGRQRTSVEVAELRKLGLGRRIASLGMLHQRSTSPTVSDGPRKSLNQEK